MRVENLFGLALKEDPAEADVAGQRLLMRAGYVRQLGSGIYTALPLAWRVMRKIEAVLREEMDAIGGQEISMPVVHPAEVWKASGRWDQVGSEMLRFKDRRGADMALGMTHEEVVAWHVKTEVQSYRQLPMLVYQLQTKFRDEPRARGGLIRVREFVMKDSYSLDADQEGLDAQYDAHHAAYHRIFERCGLPVISVKSDTGMMGGTVAHEFMYVSEIGEDHLVLCDGCDYAANREVAAFRRALDDNGEPAPIEKVATPDAKTIADLAAFLDVPASRTAKVVLMWAEPADDDREPGLVMAIVRGDMELNEIALSALLKAPLRPAVDEEIRAAGVVPGYASAMGASGLQVVVDTAVAESSNLVAGANEEGFHLLNTNCGRDYTPDQIGSIAMAHEGAGCVECGAPLKLVRGVEVGNIFQLGTRYTEAVEATFLDNTGRGRPVIMGSYGIGVGRLFACLAEEHQDENGLKWPKAMAPFQVALVALVKKPDGLAAAQALYDALTSAGVTVLLDDRKKVSPGVKFAEADLRGTPFRVVISDRGLKDGMVELKHRGEGEAWTVPLDGAADAILAALD